jgi:Predicted transcriptional regulator
MIPMPPEIRDNLPPWGAERRLEFIDFRLRWDRTVNRSDLVEFFRISPQQASADLARYAELAPGNLEYDKSLKTYRATAAFKPATARHDPQSYLDELVVLSSGVLSTAASFIGWQPACDVVRYPARPIDTHTLLQLLWAIRDGEELKVMYQSMRRPSPTLRWIAPHALASDGQRWHVRAWCHENGDFRDFVISRIRAVQDRRETVISGVDDESWHTHVDIVLAPRAGLTDGQRRATEIDFNMSRGRLKLSCRKALAFYLLRQLQLDRPPDQSLATQPLELVNRAEMTDVLAAAQKPLGFPPLAHVGHQEFHHERT